MTPDQPDLRNDLVHALVNADMPDGSPISSRVKAETILDYLGITDPPASLVQLLGLGVGLRLRGDRRRRRPKHQEPEAEPAIAPVPTPDVQPCQMQEEISVPPLPAAPRRKPSQPRAPKLNWEERQRRRGPERVSLSRPSGFALGETVKITIKQQRTQRRHQPEVRKCGTL